MYMYVSARMRETCFYLECPSVCYTAELLESISPNAFKFKVDIPLGTTKFPEPGIENMAPVGRSVFQLYKNIHVHVNCWKLLCYGQFKEIYESFNSLMDKSWFLHRNNNYISVNGDQTVTLVLILQLLVNIDKHLVYYSECTHAQRQSDTSTPGLWICRVYGRRRCRLCHQNNEHDQNVW